MKRGPKPKPADRRRSEKLTTALEPALAEYITGSTGPDETVSTRMRQLIIKGIASEQDERTSSGVE